MPWTKPYSPPENQRLDPALYTDPVRVTFITIRAYQMLTPLEVSARNKTILGYLEAEQNRNHCRIFTYCLMPDHLHFLISPDENGASVLKFTDQFKGKATNLSWKHGWRGKLWQPRFYDHIVRTDESLRRIAEYILGNPVRKALVARVKAWPWSGEFNPLPC